MRIKVALVALLTICLAGPVLQTLRFRRFGRGSPWRIPALWTLEGLGWDLTGTALAALVGQGALVVLGHPWADRLPALALNEPLRLAGLAVGVAGAAVAFASQMAMGESWRVGTDPEALRPLVTGGLFGRVRNPIYLGLLLQVAGCALLVPTALSGACMLLALAGLNVVVASEERFLQERYGQEYRDYMARTGRFLPRPGAAGK